jgi:predicted flap endonuclease-1-like 5' DNA nuclease
MAVNIRNFAGINHSIVPGLWAQGLRTNEDLLARSGTREARKTLAQSLGVDDGVILELVCRADLARVKGIGNLYAGLLNELEVRSIPDLARQDGEQLHRQMEEVNRKRRLTRRLPKPACVAQWVATARGLPPVVEL